MLSSEKEDVELDVTGGGRAGDLVSLPYSFTESTEFAVDEFLF